MGGRTLQFSPVSTDRELGGTFDLMASQVTNQAGFTVVEGGRIPLSTRQRQAVSLFADVLRGLTDEQVHSLVELIYEFRNDGYLERVQAHEIPTVKILAEVINGWELEGSYEFAQAWASTLVARQDGFDWSDCTPREKAEHRKRVGSELQRRGVPQSG